MPISSPEEVYKVSLDVFQVLRIYLRYKILEREKALLGTMFLLWIKAVKAKTKSRFFQGIDTLTLIRVPKHYVETLNAFKPYNHHEFLE